MFLSELQSRMIPQQIMNKHIKMKHTKKDLVLVLLNNKIISQNAKKYVLIPLDNVNYILEIIVLNNRLCYVVNNTPTDITFSNVIFDNINIDIQYLKQQDDSMYQNTNVTLFHLAFISIVKSQWAVFHLFFKTLILFGWLIWHNLFININHEKRNVIK